jgi:murein L,D-transpeptidase YcbB/YkuD
MPRRSRLARCRSRIALCLVPWLVLCPAASLADSAASAPGAAAHAGVDPDAIDLPGTPLADESVWLRRVYGAGAPDLLWFRDGTVSPEGSELRGILEHAQRYGLQPQDYGVSLLAAIDAAPQPLAPEARRRFDVLYSRAALRLIAHLHYGRIDPRAAGFELTPPRQGLDLAAQLRRLATAAHVADALQEIEPPFTHYRLLEDALPRYLALAADPTLRAPAPPGSRALHAGDAYADAAALRTWLRALGDLPVEGRPTLTPASEGAGTPAAPSGPGTPVAPPAPDTVFDARLALGVQHFQARHGLTADGVLGAGTYAALSTPLSRRVQQIALTLERWRWLPAFESPPIIVNIPQFQLFAFRSTADRGADILQMPVIVGQTFRRTRTPVFIGDLRYLVFRPYWDVPHDIAVRELLPQIRARDDYLARQGLEIVRGAGDDAVSVEPTPATLAALAAGQLRLRQRPGPDNALGLVKFVFPNAHDVYMHATPAHQLFQQARRAFSHGCIRVSDPVALAAHVLRATGDWSPERIEAAMQGADNQRVALRAPIRVMILYATALATEDGRVLFFDDLYGHDALLEQLLELRATSLAAAPRQSMLGR